MYVHVCLVSAVLTLLFSSAYRSVLDSVQQITFEETAPSGCVHGGSTTVDDWFWKLAIAKLPTLRSIGATLKNGLLDKWATCKKQFQGGKGVVLPLKECLSGRSLTSRVEGLDVRNSTWRMTATDVTGTFEHSIASTYATVFDMLHAACPSGTAFNVLFAGGLSENDYFRAEVSRLQSRAVLC